MRKDGKVTKLDFSDDFLLDCAENKYQAGDYFGALRLIAQRNERYAPSADAFALAADVYEALELYPMCADCWFRFLDTCNEADFAEGYEGLAVSFMNMGDAVQAAIFYRLSLDDGEFPEAVELDPEEFLRDEPKLRLVRSDSEEGEYSVVRGVNLMKTGDLKGARETFLSVPENCADRASAAGLAAMCLLLTGDEEGAERECAELYGKYPQNVQTLTTYCAVLGARGNKEGAEKIAKELSQLPVTATEDMYRVSTALCETGLHEEAYALLSRLKDKAMRYDENVLWFHAVAARNTGRLDEAISSLERLTDLYPRKAVAKYYLEKLRAMRDGEGEIEMRYYYRLPPDEYRSVADFFLDLEKSDGKSTDVDLFNRNFRLAFDEMEGRDTKLQLLAAKEAAAFSADNLLREVLLDYNEEEIVKISIIHDLTVRGEEDSFGTVICNRYKEFFTHRLEIGSRKHEAFMKAFADVYSKFVLIEDGNGSLNEDKLCDAAEDVYDSLSEAGALGYADHRAEISAAIYREARLLDGVRGLDEIVKLFDADKTVTEEILNFLI